MAPKKPEEKAGKKVQQPVAKKVKKRFQVKGTKKPIGGDKNGKERFVPAKRRPSSYPTQANPNKVKTKRPPFTRHKLRPSITPGTVLIILAGKQKGKRVVYLKQLKSGLLLVTGPIAINGCPLRRVNHRYVIATKTKLNIDNIKLPEQLTDSYFVKKKKRATPKSDSDIFEPSKEPKTISPEMKENQMAVDKQILDAISKHPDNKLFTGYLKSVFWLRKNQFPHKMVF